jgi:hypothetical protein
LEVRKFDGEKSRTEKLMRNWKRERAKLISIILIGCFWASACQSASESVLEKYKYCSKTGEPSQFWVKYNLPKVTGAELCSEYTPTKGKANIVFLHYHQGKQDFPDFYFPYREEFTKNDWKIEKEVTGKDLSWGMYVSKEGDRFYASFENCYEGQTVYLKRPCSLVSIDQTDDKLLPISSSNVYIR